MPRLPPGGRSRDPLTPPRTRQTRVPGTRRRPDAGEEGSPLRTAPRTPLQTREASRILSTARTHGLRGLKARVYENTSLRHNRTGTSPHPPFPHRSQRSNERRKSRRCRACPRSPSGQRIECARRALRLPFSTHGGTALSPRGPAIPDVDVSVRVSLAPRPPLVLEGNRGDSV